MVVMLVLSFCLVFTNFCFAEVEFRAANSKRTFILEVDVVNTNCPADKLNIFLNFKILTSPSRKSLVPKPTMKDFSKISEILELDDNKSQWFPYEGPIFWKGEQLFDITNYMMTFSVVFLGIDNNIQKDEAIKQIVGYLSQNVYGESIVVSKLVAY